jgi:hypothetical protein
MLDLFRNKIKRADLASQRGKKGTESSALNVIPEYSENPQYEAPSRIKDPEMEEFIDSLIDKYSGLTIDNFYSDNILEEAFNYAYFRNKNEITSTGFVCNERDVKTAYKFKKYLAEKHQNDVVEILKFYNQFIKDIKEVNQGKGKDKLEIDPNVLSYESYHQYSPQFIQLLEALKPSDDGKPQNKDLITVIIKHFNAPESVTRVELVESRNDPDFKENELNIIQKILKL